MKKTRSHAVKRTREQIEKQYIRDSASLNCISIVAFGHEALREAYRVWWNPVVGMGEDFKHLTGQSIYEKIGHGYRRVKGPDIVSGDTIMLRKLDPQGHRVMQRVFGKSRGSTKRSPVRVKLIIDYPVTRKQIKIVTIDRRYPGEIFSILHDFYREIYALDEKQGGKAGPSPGSKLINRGFGPLVWGHDIGDLVIESIHYKKLDKDPEGAEGVFSFRIGS